MKTSLVKIDAPEMQGIEESKAKQIKSAFEPMVEMLEEFEDAYTKILKESSSGITEETTSRAKRLRLDISKVRIETEKRRKNMKEEYLRAGKAIDGVSNILKWAVTDKENKLKEIEDYFEIQERKRLEELQETRAEILSKYVPDAHERNLSHLQDDEFEALLKTKKQEHEDNIAAQKRAEEERVKRQKAEEEERARIKAENEKLRQQAEKERKEKEKIEAMLKEKQEQERKAKQAEEEKRQALLDRGDEDKVKDLVSDLRGLKEKYSFKSEKYKKVYSGVCVLIEKIVGYIEKG